ncbi:MAG TPA: cupin domain-containing protein [Rhizomicrobium sp.]|nr:cupin domain-containing protein [Rhizomicrobium sp.]
MTQFDQLVSPLGADVFLREHWLKSPAHIAGKKGRFADLLSWGELSAILEQHRLTPPRLKLYRDGQPVDPGHYLTPAMFGVPRLDAGGLAVCLAQGASLILDDAQELAPKLRDLMHVFQDALHTDAFANLYAGWHTQQAFNRHWDAQEAIVLQLQGRKHWKVYHPTRLHPLKNDLEPPPPPSGAPAWDGILNDGDVLYIPRGWWHEAFPLNEPSLHLTVSLTPPTTLDYLGWVMSRLRAHAELRASLPAHDAAAQGAAASAVSSLVSDALRQAPLSDFLREWDANIRPSPHIRLPQAAYEQFSAINQNSRIRLASLHRLSFSAQGADFAFIAAGRMWTVPKALQPALAQLQNNREIAVAELAAALPPSAKADLLKSLGVLAQAGVVLVANS